MRARSTRMLVTAIVGVVVAASAAHAIQVAGQSAAPSDEDRLLLGTWKLNLSKSTYKVGPAPREQTRTYEAEGQGVRATIKTTNASGRSTTVQYVANYDSHEYPLTGSADADAIKLKKVAPRTAEATLSHAGKVMATVRRVIAEDGKTMTITYEGQQQSDRVNYIAVYDKQP
jgi:hypothetical protein